MLASLGQWSPAGRAVVFSAPILNRIGERRGFACPSWILAPDLTLLTAFGLRDHPTMAGLVRQLGCSASLDDPRPVCRALA